jgi:hypothetical protein
MVLRVPTLADMTPLFALPMHLFLPVRFLPVRFLPFPLVAASRLAVPVRLLVPMLVAGAVAVPLGPVLGLAAQGAPVDLLSRMSSLFRLSHLPSRLTVLVPPNPAHQALVHQVVLVGCPAKVASMACQAVGSGPAGAARAVVVAGHGLTARLSDVTLTPNTGSLPGGQVLQNLMNGLGGWALALALVGLVIGAAAWALGSHGQNYQQSYVGRRAVLISGLAALLIGAGPAIVNFFFHAGQGVH